MRLSERLYRLLLRCYPREFRDEYGEEMTAYFLAGTGGGRVRQWLQALADSLFHAPSEHWHTFRQDLRYAARTWRR